ncbi:hypothetical protein V9T40_010679 [Parthenolecanium corni]|uniref:DUF7153 domain-containing protein n=1 Tax=Parthenolecanium corni TaxID=536013 RepID=A0AAN9T411_9HEMI
MSYSSIIYPKASQLIRHTESVVDVHSKATPFRHFGIKPEIEENEEDGATVTFKFASLSKYENGNALPFLVLQDQLTTALKLSYPYGVILQSKEKSAVYPVVQFCHGGVDTKTRDEVSLIQGYTSQIAPYKEVRQIEPEVDSIFSNHLSSFYIILGFKTSGTQALLDSWKDWTGARYIYINFPEQLCLKKITLYRRESTDDMNLFSFIVVVLCDGVDSKEKQRTLLDFVQRLRAERTSNFISVYEEVIT